MTALSLDEVPAQIKTTAQEIWLHGQMGEPQVGDLWLLSWNGDALSLAVIGSIYSGFVRVWPVTLEIPAETGMAVELLSSHFESPLALWPHAETGIGSHLLHRKIDSVLSPRQVHLVRRFVYDHEPSPLPLFTANEHKSGTVGTDEIIRLFQQLCFIEWPENRPGEAVLARETLANRGKTAEDVALALDMDVSEVLAVWTGKQTLGESAVEQLCSRFNLPFEEIFKSPNGSEVLELQRPEYKDGLRLLAKLRNISEVESRKATREEFALAARSTGPNRTLPNKVRSALDRLIAEHHAAS